MTVRFDPHFEREFRRIRDAALQERVRKQIARIIIDPTAGKPMRYQRKRTRETYIPPFRLSYLWTGDEVVLLAIYHKDEQ